MRTALSKMSALALAMLFLLSVIAGCVPRQEQPNTTNGVTATGTYKPTETFNPSQDVAAKSFQSEEELLAFIKSNGNDGYGGGMVFSGRAMAESDSSTKMVASAAPQTAPGGADYSMTNNQVANVDEGDIIKTDGQYIYTITGNTLFIVTAGADAKVLKTIEFNQTPSGLFIDGNRLAVFGNFYDLDYFRSIGIVPRSGMTFFNVYDIADKSNPTLLKEYKFEGSYYESRMHDGKAYLVVTSTPESRDLPMPYIIDGTVTKQMAVSDISFYPVPYDSVQFQTVHAVSLNDLQAPVSSKAVAVEWGTTLYMSEKNIYLASTENINEWEIQQQIMMTLLEPKLTDADKDLIRKIKATDDDVLSQAEKKNKIYQVYSTYQQFMTSSEQQDLQKQLDDLVAKEMERYDSLSYTIINRISIADGVKVEATGKVPGTLNNQFAMDEHNDVLRVATTIQPRWGGIRPMMAQEAVAVDAPADPTSGAMIMEKRAVDRVESVNNVYALDANMKIIGSLTELAKGEQIYSTRFIGDRLYMVTYRQIDPFFVIDLSNPRSIKQLGELKVPGFSRYLHPYDDNIIIGIGRDASATGNQQGLKISLFDVTNVEKPREIAKWVATDDYAQSAAEWEHKAFLFSREKQLLVIPGYSYNYDYNRGTGKQQFNGAMVFKITPTEITMRGIVDHSKGNEQYWAASVERSLWIDEMLYTKSPNLLRVNALADLKSVANVTLVSSTTGPYAVY